MKESKESGTALFPNEKEWCCEKEKNHQRDLNPNEHDDRILPAVVARLQVAHNDLD
jgi:hypothetical protein